MFSLEVFKADLFSGGEIQNDYLYSDDFSGSVEANAGGGGIGGGNGGSGASGNGVGTDNSGGGAGLDANANGGPATVDLGANSPSSGSTMEFSAADAKALGVAALSIAGGVLAVSKGNVAAAALSVSGMALSNSSSLGTAMSHAAHDIGVSQANSPVADPNNIGLYESTSEQATIDAINSDGGFGNLYPVVGGQVIDQSVGGNVLATDQVAGGHSLYWDNFYAVNPYARVQF